MEFTRKIHLQDVTEDWAQKNLFKNDSGAYLVFKEIVDVFFSMIGFVFLVILFLPIAFCIKLDSKGYIIYKQERTGKNGKKFFLYKFRTMSQNGRETTDTWREKDKQNITRVGKVLRRLHLDELPQAWNIVKGEVSFIGPRAEWSVLAETFEREIPFYTYRYLVRPGIIGWAQINFPPSRSLAEAAQKFEYDLYYIKNHSFLLDLEIILKSFKLFFW